MTDRDLRASLKRRLAEQLHGAGSVAQDRRGAEGVIGIEVLEVGALELEGGAAADDERAVVHAAAREAQRAAAHVNGSGAGVVEIDILYRGDARAGGLDEQAAVYDRRV